MSVPVRRAALQCVVPVNFLPVIGTAYTDDLFDRCTKDYKETDAVQLTLHISGTTEDVGALVAFIFNHCSEPQFFFQPSEGDFHVILPGMEDRLKVWKRETGKQPAAASPNVRARVRKRLPAAADA